MRQVKIKEYPNYEITDDGRVFSVRRNKYLQPHIWKNKRGHAMAQTTLRNKYGKKQPFIARLVAQHFIENPDNLCDVDHIDRNALNNKVENLRWASRSQNNANRQRPKRKNKSGMHSLFKGCYWDTTNRNWRSDINVNKKRKHLGNFANQEDAARAYNEAAKKYHGEFAYLNPV